MEERGPGDSARKGRVPDDNLYEDSAGISQSASAAYEKKSGDMWHEKSI